jgi:hypothetical protein
MWLVMWCWGKGRTTMSQSRRVIFEGLELDEDVEPCLLSATFDRSVQRSDMYECIFDSQPRAYPNFPPFPLALLSETNKIVRSNGSGLDWTVGDKTKRKGP